MLTASLAQQIADENASATGLGILITDRDGVVIGSSDPRRVGTFHEASIDVVRSREPASHSARQAAALRGVRPGLTLPIIVDTDVVGTVGITGPPAGVRRLGPLVRRHTEMLLRESAALRTQLLQEKGIEDLVRDIAAYDPDLIDTAALTARADELGFSLTVSRLAILFGVSVEPGQERAPREAASVLRGEIIRTIREQFRDPEDIVAATTAGRFLLLHRYPERACRDRSHSDVASACDAVVGGLSKRHRLALRAAIGSIGTTPAQIKDAVADAFDAFLLAGRLPVASAAARSINELRTYQLLSAMPQRTRRRLMETELVPLRAQADWPLLRATLCAWCESGFKLVDAAALLHVHRNTLLYRLSRLERLTGRSLRDYPALLPTYLACLADQLDEARTAADRRVSRELDGRV